MTTPFNEMERSMGSQSAFQWSRKTFRFAVCAAGAFLGGLCLLAAQARALDPAALPTGGRITAGQGRIDATGSAMTVTQDTHRMIADWNSFNIGSNASVAFVQPGASSVALNRIQDTAPSQIFGRLSANGQVFLLNPAGVIFGPTARVDVGALVASSLALSDEDFMAGRYALQGTGSKGFVFNQGNIRTADGGYVAFVAPLVENRGTVVSPEGMVAMAAGDKVRLDFSGDRLVNYIVDKGAVDALAANSGTISADGGTVMLSAAAADALTRSVVNHTGVIEAKSLAEKNGRIVLIADTVGGDVHISGRLDVSGAGDGASGGTLVATAETVMLDGGATIDAHGSAGGGEIYLGGGWQGSDPAIANTTETVIDLGTTLDASALDNGDGGTIVVWSDGNTFFNGAIFSRGGEEGGDGGRAEVSGKGNLGFWGTVDVTSPLGRNGLLLLDPSNITIADGSAGQTGTYADWSNHDDYGSWIIPETVLEGLAGDVILTAVTDIIIENLSDNVLNLSADSISFFSNDESGPSSSGGFSMDASDTIRLDGAGNLTLQGGNLSVGGGYSIYAGNLETNGGDVIFNTKRSGAASPIRVAGTITTNGGSVAVAAGTRFGLDNSENVDVQLDGLVSTSGGDFTSNMIGAVQINGGMNLGAGTATFGGTNTQINSVIISTSNVTISAPLTFGAGSGITTTGAVTFNQTAAMASAGADLTLTASDFVFNDTFSGNSGTITLKPYNAATNVDIGSAGTGDMVISNASLLQLSGFADITIGRSDGTGTTKVVSSASVAAGQLTLINDTIDVSAGTLSNTAGDIVLTGDTFDIGQAITANGGTGRAVLQQLTPDNTLTLGTGVTDAVLDNFNAGTLVVGRTDGGNVVFDGNISTTSSQVHFLSGGDITIDNGASLDVGTGTAVIAAGGNFINNAGAGAISTTGEGRWLVYSTDPANNTFGGLASGNLALWNKTYAGYPPDSVTETGSRYLFSIQPDATVTAVNRNKTYGEALDLTSPVLGTHYNVTGMVDASVYGNVFTQATAADIVSGDPALVSAGAAAGASVAGSPYALTITAGGLTTPTGYNLATFTAATVTVAQAPLTVTANNAAKTYDTLAYSGGNGVIYDGLVNGETAAVLGGSLAYGGTSQGGRDVGSYVITPSGLTSGNYTLTFSDGTLTVNPAELTITAQADTKVYDGGLASAVAPLVSGLLGADTITGLSQAFADKNAGTGKTLNLSAYTLNDGNSGNNYSVTAVISSDGVITPKSLTAAYTAGNKVYDATTTATVAETSGDIIAGDTVTFSQDSAFEDKNVGDAKTVNITAIALVGADAGNYSLANSSTTATADIAPKALTAAYTAENKAYDGTTTATVDGFSADVIAGDKVLFLQDAEFTDRFVGPAKTVHITGIALAGADGANYNLQNTTATATASIVPVTPENLLSPQASVNGTQAEQGGRSGNPTTPALGPGSGSTTLAAATTTPLVGSAPVLSSAQVTTPVRFSTQGSATTMEIGSGAGTGPMADVGAIPVFNQTGQGAPVAQGSLYVRESASAVSVTPGDAVSGAPAPAEPGIPDGSALSFTLATPEGMTIELSASVTENGVLVIDLPDAAAGVDPAQAVLMGMTIVKKEKNIGAGALKGVLLRRR